MLMLITAAASAASSRRSQWTYDPSPIGSAVDHDLEHAADRVAVRARLVDAGDHRRLGVGIRAAQRRGVRLVAGAGGAGRVDRHAADLGRERPDLDAQLAQERPRDAARGDPRGRLARGRALERVAHVVEAVLERAGEVGVPGPDAGDRRGRACCRPRRAAASSAASSSLSGPTCITRVQFAQSRLSTSSRIGEPSVRPCRTPDRISRPVVLDRLAGAAAVATLAAGEVDREVVLGQGEPGGHALDHGAEHRAMALAGR